MHCSDMARAPGGLRLSPTHQRAKGRRAAGAACGLGSARTARLVYSTRGSAAVHLASEYCCSFLGTRQTCTHQQSCLVVGLSV
jgi:hydroxymethylpyrimidine/phosphomethylpyrimidine kinase